MSEPIWLDEAVAFAVHERTLLFHGGAGEIRDAGLLQSALGRPRHLASYDDDADLCALAAAYTAGIVKSHPFVDGDKRTGFVMGILFLELNGARFVASEEAAAAAVLALAASQMDDAGYATFLRANTAWE